jgi:hypothetical protein
MFFSIETVSTFLAIWSIEIKIKLNEKAKQHKTRANQMEFQNIYVLQFVKSFTVYYIKCLYPRIWVSRAYVQELRWESVKKVSTKKNLIIIKKLAPQKKHVLGHNY